MPALHQLRCRDINQVLADLKAGKGTIAQMRDAHQRAAASCQAIGQQVTGSVSRLAQEVQQQDVAAPQHGPVTSG